jgi:pyridoxine 4-dehydrogenase
VDAGANVLNSATFYGVEDPLANLKLLSRFFEEYPDYVDKTVVVVKGGMKNFQLITE